MPLPKLPEGAPVASGHTRQSVPGRHRGGAWKVAYADFVTALMALFIVLWMMHASSQVKESVSGYFRDPRGYTHKIGAGPAGAGEGVLIGKKDIAGMQSRIEQALRRVPEFEKLRQNIKFSVTGEGLRIDLEETEQGLFFMTGGAEPTEAGEHLLAALAAEVGRMPNSVVIEGHTDSRAFRNSGPSSGYSNWELSADRANAARRLLHQYGVRPQQVVEVRGFADERLMIPNLPDDPRNRRVSLVVKFVEEQ